MAPIPGDRIPDGQAGLVTNVNGGRLHEAATGAHILGTPKPVDVGRLVAASSAVWYLERQL